MGKGKIKNISKIIDIEKFNRKVKQADKLAKKSKREQEQNDTKKQNTEMDEVVQIDEEVVKEAENDNISKEETFRKEVKLETEKSNPEEESYYSERRIENYINRKDSQLAEQKRKDNYQKAVSEKLRQQQER